MREFLIIGLGAWAGAGSRYAIGQWMSKAIPVAFPYGTLVVNALGCLLIGLLGTMIFRDPNLRLLLAVGFLGSFTTFSSFSLETVDLIQRGLLIQALGYVMMSLLLGLAATFFGYHIGRLMPWS